MNFLLQKQQLGVLAREERRESPAGRGAGSQAHEDAELEHSETLKRGDAAWHWPCKPQQFETSCVYRPPCFAAITFLQFPISHFGNNTCGRGAICRETADHPMEDNAHFSESEKPSSSMIPSSPSDPTATMRTQFGETFRYGFLRRNA